MKASELELGKLTMRGSNSFELKLSQVAVDDSGYTNQIYLASVIGPATAVKAFCAVMALDGGRNETTFYVEQVPGISQYAPCVKHKGQGRYKFYRRHLGFNTYHAIAVSKEASFLPNAGSRAVWNALSGPDYTTPVLPGWMPYITDVMKDTGLIRDLLCFQCKCGLMTATTDDLDTIVSGGLREGKISIPIRKEAMPIG